MDIMDIIIGSECPFVLVICVRNEWFVDLFDSMIST